MDGKNWNSGSGTASSPMDQAYLSPAQVARRLGKHPSTVARWILSGVGGVKLQAVRLGARWATTAAWVDDFLHRCTNGAPRSFVPPPNTSRSEGAAQRASNALAARGF